MQANAGDVTPVAIALYANNSGFVVISVTAQYGATSLYANGYPRPAVPSQGGSQWVSAVAQPLQALPLEIKDVCDAGAIRGTNPPQCGINMIVVSPVASLFRVAVEVSNSGAYLLPGQAYPGAVLAGGLFVVQFSVPNNFINVSLLVTMQDGGDNATIAIGRNSWNRNSSLWTVPQTPGNALLSWSLDWTDPKLSPRGVEQGDYYAFVTASTTTTFTVLYLLTNATGYNGSPAALIAGQSQYGLLPRAGQVNFYTFTPPATGWPYTTIISCTFMGGDEGSLSTSTGDGSVVGPTPGVNSWFGRRVWTASVQLVEPTDGYSCNPNVPLPSGQPCLYQMAVQSLFSSDGVVEYLISATTSSSLRTIRPGASVSSVIAAGGVEYWQMSYVTYSSALVNFLVAAVVTQGEVVLYGSNTTVPSVSTAQQLVTPLPAGLLSYLTTASTPVYYFVTVNCSAAVDCYYSLQFTANPPGSGGGVNVPLSLGSPSSVLLGPGRSAYCYVNVGSLRSIGYLLMQTQSSIGSVVLFSAFSANVPTNSSYDWMTADSSTLELTNLSFPLGSSSMFRITAQAGAASASLFTVSVDVAGVSGALYSGGQLTGLLTTAFPVSYFDYYVSSYIDGSTLLALGFYSFNCPASTQLYISDTLQRPGPGQQGVTYNYTGTAVLTQDNRTQVSAILSSNALFSASLHPGPYYFAVVGDGQTNCTFQLGLQQSSLVSLQADQTFSYLTVYGGLLAYWAFTMQAATDAAIALQFRANAYGSLTVYTAVGGLPNPADPGSYSVVSTFSSGTRTAGGALYLPGSLCPITAASLASGCQVLMAAVSNNASAPSFSLVSMVTATTLTAGKTVVGVSSSVAPSYYQMPVPAGVVGTVSLTVFSSAPLQLYCSYQFIRPSPQLFDWNVSVVADNSSTVNISWSAPLLNAVNGVAPPAAACYCSLSAISAGFTLAYVFTVPAAPPPPPALPSSSSSSSSSASRSVSFSSSSSSASSSPSSSPSSSSSSPSSSASPAVSFSSSSSSSASATPSPVPALPSSGGGLSSSALFAAIFVPVLVAVIAVVVLVWLCRRNGGCGCRPMRSKGDPSPSKAEPSQAGGAAYMTEQSENAAPMSELQTISYQRPRVAQSSLLSSRGVQSDA